jgi:hypothetical protein
MLAAVRNRNGFIRRAPLKKLRNPPVIRSVADIGFAFFAASSRLVGLSR